jgi:hypothetical protein
MPQEDGAAKGACCPNSLAGRARTPCAPRLPEQPQNAKGLAAFSGAQRSARPTFERAVDLGNKPTGWHLPVCIPLHRWFCSAWTLLRYRSGCLAPPKQRACRWLVSRYGVACLRIAGNAGKRQEAGRRMKQNGGQNEESEGQQREMGRVQPPFAGARVLRICYGRRSGRLAGHEVLGVFLPTINDLVGAKEQHGADGRLIELADAEGA